ncbi:MAG: rhomboid family intramembrane serine protease [Chloroflexi bacterium]|nr:rhomboid family intramembrane serine protease [Chloroflexota bacterium]
MIPLYDTLRSRRFPLVNWLLIGANVLVFLYEIRLSSGQLRGLIETRAVIPAHLVGNPPSQWITLFSAMFLHGGWFHILSNMWVLFIFGDNVEERMGKMGYLVFYLLCGAAAGILQAYILPTSSLPMIGASGAIAGVLGAYLILFPRARVASIVPIFFIFTLVELPAVIFLAFWFILQLFSGLMALEGAVGGGVAWWAHIGGFLFGILTVSLFARRRVYRTW